LCVETDERVVALDGQLREICAVEEKAIGQQVLSTLQPGQLMVKIVKD